MSRMTGLLGEPPSVRLIIMHRCQGGVSQCRLDSRMGLSRACAVTPTDKNSPGLPIRSVITTRPGAHPADNHGGAPWAVRAPGATLRLEHDDNFRPSPILVW
eukprot:5276678-Prymnesium_polylepis.1